MKLYYVNNPKEATRLMRFEVLKPTCFHVAIRSNTEIEIFCAFDQHMKLIDCDDEDTNANR